MPSSYPIGSPSCSAWADAMPSRHSSGAKVRREAQVGRNRRLFGPPRALTMQRNVSIGGDPIAMSPGSPGSGDDAAPYIHQQRKIDSGTMLLGMLPLSALPRLKKLASRLGARGSGRLKLSPGHPAHIICCAVMLPKSSAGSRTRNRFPSSRHLLLRS